MGNTENSPSPRLYCATYKGLYRTMPPEEYFKERLRAQEDQIESLRATFELARQRRNKKLMGRARKQLELALRLREMYQRLLSRDRPPDQLAL